MEKETQAANLTVNSEPVTVVFRDNRKDLPHTSSLEELKLAVEEAYLIEKTTKILLLDENNEELREVRPGMTVYVKIIENDQQEKIKDTQENSQIQNIDEEIQEISSIIKSEQVTVVFNDKRRELPYTSLLDNLKLAIEKTFFFENPTEFKILDENKEELREVIPGMTVYIKIIRNDRQEIVASTSPMEIVKYNSVTVVHGNKRKQVPHTHSLSKFKFTVAKMFSFKRRMKFMFLDEEKKRLRVLRPGMTVFIKTLKENRNNSAGPVVKTMEIKCSKRTVITNFYIF